MKPLLCASALVLLAGCDSVWGGFLRPRDVGVCNANSACWGQTATTTFRSQNEPQVDVLFVVDNSGGMGVPQAELAQDALVLVTRLANVGADYHIGVVTTDVGSRPDGGAFTAYAGCDSVAGDDGRLQTAVCQERSWQNSTEAMRTCTQLCQDPNQRIQDGSAFIAGKGAVTNVPAVMDGGRDVGPARALSCLLLAGDRGCEIEGPMEAMKRALDGRNAGFLRDGSALGVVMLTSEDDCSVQRREENSTAGLLDCDAPDKEAGALCFNPDYRCLARSVLCNEALNKAGDKTGCAERDGSYLFPEAIYSSFLQAIRPAGNVVLTGLWPPRLGGAGTLLRVVERGGPESFNLDRGSLPPDTSCSGVSRGSTLVGRPQLRLSRLVELVTAPDGLKGRSGGEGSVCAPADYTTRLLETGTQLLRLSVRCLPQAPVVKPPYDACLVGDMDSEGGTPQTFFPSCGAGCCNAFATSNLPLATHDTVADACAGEARTCYCAVPSQAGFCPGGAVAGVIRKEAPQGKLTSFRCALQ